MSMSGVAECTSCFEVKPSQDFPRTTLTPRCQHTATLCLACVALFLESQSRNGLMDQLSCPECPELLAYDAIEDYATAELFERYKTYSIDRLVSGVSGHAWCPLGCGKGQVIGAHRGITLCLTCNRQFCPRHRMAWHIDYTCDEYDMYLTNPSFQKEEAKKLLERKKLEEDLTNQNFRTLTKPCPGCRVPIEKNNGW
ncbi:hypothetical protein GGR58DRAFT_516494 [Xylaria digitata]|nr:hypothetical protein GGR58DRAFT_516494 [Xylaria digitata]